MPQAAVIETWGREGDWASFGRYLAGFGVVSAQDPSFGAKGDGIADDTAPIQSLLTAAAGGSAFIPAGTYLLSSTPNIPAGTTVYGSGPQTILKIKNAGNCDALNVLGANVTIRDLTIDGNKANQTIAHTGIFSDAQDSLTVERVTVQSTKSYGMDLRNGNHLRVRSCTVVDSDNWGILVTAGTTSITDVEVAGNRVDRSSLAAATIVGGGIAVVGQVSSSSSVKHYRVHDNDVFLPTSPTDVACIGITTGTFLVAHGTVRGNTLRGGYMGISVDSATNDTVTSNTIFGASVQAVELAKSSRCTVSANTIDGNGLTVAGIRATNTTPDRNAIVGNVIYKCVTSGIEVVNCNRWTLSGNVIDGNGTMTQGILVSASNFTTISGGNTIYNTTGACILVQGASAHTTITGNTLDQTAATYGINLNGSTVQYVTITGNTLNGNATGTHGVIAAATQFLVVTGNTFHAWTTAAVLLYAASAVTLDWITVTGNYMNATGGATTDLTGGAVLGVNVVLTGNVGPQSGDYPDFKNNVRRLVGSGTPEAAVVAGIGSIFQRRDGGAATSTYVKESGTGNTGWIAK
jgi:parallel beta-helix repeat protein